MSKYKHFLNIADQLFAEFHAVPLLFGSLGLQIRLQTDLHADDIDILVPESLLHEQWNLLISLMERLGYTLYDQHEHAFSCGDIHVAFAKIESLEPFAGVNYKEVPLVLDGNSRYFLLELEDYLRVYTASAMDGYRANKKHKNDSAKIKLIKQTLAERDEKEHTS